MRLVYFGVFGEQETNGSGADWTAPKGACTMHPLAPPFPTAVRSGERFHRKGDTTI